jgi:hypothetical protein
MGSLKRGRAPGRSAALRRAIPMSNVTELAAGQITTADAIAIELVEADETPTVVIIR